MEEEMPDALQVPDPEGFIIHANELGLYSELHHKGFMQAGNVIRLAPRKLIPQFKDMIGKETVFSNVKCYRNHIFAASSPRECFTWFSRSRVLNALV